MNNTPLTKEQALAYIKSKVKPKASPEPVVVGEIPVSREEVLDEVSQLEGFNEFKRNDEKHLTSDEG